MTKKVIIILLVSVMLMLSLPLYGFAKDAPAPLYSSSCMVYNIENQKTCYEYYPDDRIAPAGTTKIMTAILAIEHYENNFDAVITVGQSWLTEVTGLTAGFMIGENITAEKVISALIIGNGNDAAYVLAHAIAGSEETFVAMMNEKAKEMGMENTRYVNPAGTDEEGAYTTAADVVKLSCYAYTLSKYIEISDAPSVAMEATNKNNGRNLYNRNYFVSNYYNTKYLTPSVMGLNAGYSYKAGWCVTAIGRSNSGLTYVVVVLGGRDPEPELDENGEEIENEDKFFVSGYEDALMLLDWAYNNFGYFTLVDTSTMVCDVPVKLSNKVDHVVLLPEEKLVSFLPIDTDIESVVTKEYTLKSKTLKAPISQGQVVGEMNVYIHGEKAGTVNLIARNNVDRSNGLLVLDVILGFVTNPLVLTVFALFILLVIIYVIFKARYLARKRQVVKYKQNR
ncbi:MAG: D-alanyl-D-alanine carboxypeptidase [Clostridia bacterium]|nr:D-alanyl-D-alanine carboxypeptidase [Clostridia bacterium]